MSPRKAVVITCVVWFIAAFILCNILYNTGYDRGFAKGQEDGAARQAGISSERMDTVMKMYDEVVQKQIDRALVAENALKAMQVDDMESLMKHVIEVGRNQGVEIEIIYSQKFKEE